MALQMETYISGRVNNLVFFKRAGTHMSRTMPAKVKLSAKTKICSGNFGIASACGKSLRQQLLPVLPFPKDRRMQIRFSGAIAKWLGATTATTITVNAAIPFVKGFEFNEATGIAERWKLPLIVDQPTAGLIEVHIPAFVPTQAIAAPVRTILVECTITAASCLLLNRCQTGSDTININIPYNDDLINAQTISLAIASPVGTVIVTAVSLRYKLSSGEYFSKPTFLPASIIDARYC